MSVELLKKPEEKPEDEVPAKKYESLESVGMRIGMDIVAGTLETRQQIHGRIIHEFANLREADCQVALVRKAIREAFDRALRSGAARYVLGIDR